MTTKKTKKKVAKKRPVKKTPPGARDVGYRERKLKEAVSEAQLQADVDALREANDEFVAGIGDPVAEERRALASIGLTVPDGEGGTAPVLCCEHGCFAHAVEWVDEEAFCQKHLDELTAALEALTTVFRALAEQQVRVGEAVERCIDALSEPHVVGEPSTHEEILASDNAVVRDRYIASLPRPPERHVYVPPPPGPRPVLPVLQPRLLEFHTPEGRRGLLCDVAWCIVSADVVVRRVHDRLSGGATYSLAGVADLDTDQFGGEIASHYWHFATDEEHAALAACDPDEPPAASERISA